MGKTKRNDSNSTKKTHLTKNNNDDFPWHMHGPVKPTKKDGNKYKSWKRGEIDEDY